MIRLKLNNAATGKSVFWSGKEGVEKYKAH